MAQTPGYTHKPAVAIVGRPNVGKSTLFNRLVGGRIAIVEDIPGTTRDRLYGGVQWREREFTVVDTGGLELGTQLPLAEAVRRQIQTAIEEADLLVLVVDVRDGVTPADEEIADVIRRVGKPTVLAVNKVDDPKHEAAAQQFYRLGLEALVPLSAYHGTGVGDLLDWLTAHLPPVVEVPPEAEYLRVAIVGRPNVGKSMLLNAILGEERAIVSDIPGTTRDVIDTVYRYNEHHLVLIDTAGIRRRGRIERGIERYSTLRALRAIDRADVVILVLDATELVVAQDTHIAGYVRDAYKSMVVAVNKWDLAPEMGLTANQCALEVRSRLKFLPDVPILFVSAKTGQGVRDTLEAVTRVGVERTQRVPTATLNQVVSQAVLAHSPRSVRGRSLKIYYVTQAEVNPPTFVFFVNDPELLHFSYQRYLENRLREAFGFTGTPLKLVFRRRREE